MCPFKVRARRHAGQPIAWSDAKKNIAGDLAFARSIGLGNKQTNIGCEVSDVVV